MTEIPITTDLPHAPMAPPAPITLVMSDVVGSTEISVRRGDAWYLRVMECHDRVMREGLSRFCGEEIDHVGDGLLMAFSNPDDAARYCLTVKAASTRCSADRLGLSLRLAITIGSPLRSGTRLYGAAVQLASRLSSIDTRNGRPLMSDGVRRRLNRTIATEPLGPMSVKGFPKPIPVHALVEPAPTSCRRSVAPVR